MNKLDFSKYQGLITKSVWQNLFSEYKRKNDKLSDLVDQGEFIRLEKGKYISAPAWKEGNVLKYSIANALHGPSYISGYTALSYHRMIPERVVDIESVTIARSKTVDSEIGRFSYRKVSTNTFHIGINYKAVGNNGFLIADNGKALIDVIWMTNVSKITSLNAMERYLFHDLRIDEEEFIVLNNHTVKECLSLGKNKRQLKYLLKLLEKYRNGSA